MSIAGQQSTRRIWAHPKIGGVASDVVGASEQTECGICPPRTGEKGGRRSARPVFLRDRVSDFTEHKDTLYTISSFFEAVPRVVI